MHVEGGKMPNTKNWSLVLVIILVSGVLFFGCATLGRGTTSDFVGVFEGSYNSIQGEMGMTLNIFKQNGNHKAILSFYNLPGHPNPIEGAYWMDVTYIRGEYHLKFNKWIERPGGYDGLDLKGRINGDVFSGYTDIGTTFRVVRKW